MKVKHYILPAALIGFLSSCADVLDIAPDGNTTMEDVWSDATYTSAALNSCYKQIPGKGYAYRFFASAVVEASDDAYSSDEGTGMLVGQYYNATATAASHPLGNTDDYHGASLGGYWTRYWEQIRLCNQFLENIETATVSSESERSRFTAEARLLRAFFYTELYKWYGKLPIIDKTVPITEDWSTYSRAPLYDLAKFIGEDCDAAIACPDLPWRITSSSEALRVTKALAYALKSQAMLFAASPLHNEGNDYWEEAYQWNKEAVTALKANGYELYSTCAEPSVFGTGNGAAWRELACKTADYASNPRDKETIYQHKSGSVFVWHIGYIGSGLDQAYKCEAGPTQELVDAFETIDGQPILNLANPYLDEYHLQPNYNTANTLYDKNNPFENRDPRFYETVLYHGCTILWNNSVKYVVDTRSSGQSQLSLNTSDRNHTRTGYYHCKMVTPNSSGTNQHNNSTWKFYRLGEIILNYAEAACEAGHADDAYAAVNEIRSRVGMPDLPAGLSTDELRLRIHNERRVELCWEENRFFDLRRWQTPTGDLGATCKWLTAMQISGEDGNLTYERIRIRSTPRGGWENRELLIPIPQTEANNMTTLTGVDWQNPGW